MQSYLNDPELKQKLVKEIKWHQDQDAIIQGTYGEGKGDNWKGCAVGCAIHSLNKLKGENFDTSNHAVLEEQGLWPEWLARLEDTIFEGLPTEQAKKWPLRFSEAVPVGVDLEPVKWKFCAYLMSRNIERVLSLDIPDDLKEKVVSAIRGVLQVQESALKTGKWDESAAESAARSAAWSAARSAGWSAAWSAAESAAWSAARSAAWSAAWSAGWSSWSAAESAAWSAARSAAWSAARSAEYIEYADKLIELLESAPQAGK